METFFPEHLLKLLLVSITFSTILMLLIQKIKKLSLITKSCQVWILNLVLSFIIGIPFTIFFYELNIYDGIWVGLFSFIGATAIYNTLKKQNIINYTPNSVSDTITISKTREIKR